jgi:L-fucose mutarotase/ribose pyranase (RbsD/FucU family)
VVTKSSDTELTIPIQQPVITGDDIVIAVATDPNANMVVNVEDAAGNSYEQIGDAVVNVGQLRTYLFVAYDVNSMPMSSEIIITATPAVRNNQIRICLLSDRQLSADLLKI